MEELNIEQDRHIDPDQLDVEWLNQPNMFFKYSDALNEAITKRNSDKLNVEIMKDRVDHAKASLDLRIRENPDHFNLPKTTEGAINSAILTNGEYQDVLNQYYESKKDFNEAQKQVNYLYSCVQTMEERKVALQELDRLAGQQYFSTPQSRQTLGEKYHARVTKNKKGAKEKVRRKKGGASTKE